MDTTTQHPFTDRELERLSVYRTAVAAGFYSDICESTAPEPTLETEHAAGEQPRSTYPFTSAELARLTAARAAVKAGYYSDQI
jgi:hypothetical protein